MGLDDYFTPKAESTNLKPQMKSKIYRDLVVEVYLRDVDRTLLRENLKLTFEQRAEKHASALRMVEELRRAGRKLRQQRG
jgi:hypothetical protein